MAVILFIRNFIAKHNILLSAGFNIFVQPFVLFKLNEKKWFPDDFKNIFEDESYLFLYCCLLIITIFNIGIKRIKFDFDALKKELEQTNTRLDKVLYQVQSCINSSLVEFSKKLELDKEKNLQDRITVFGLRNIKGKKKFFGLSRYSDNPNFRDLSNKEYDIDKGCMAQGYSNGWHIEKGEIPSFEDNKKEYEDYFRQNYGLSHSDVRNLSMKNRYYASISIKKGVEEKGVIVFESLKSNRFDDNRIKTELEFLKSKIYDLMELLEMKEESVSQNIMSDIKNLVKNRGKM